MKFTTGMPTSTPPTPTGFYFLFALVTRNLFRISSVLAGCASEQRGVSGACMRVCTGVQSNYQQPWGNPLIPAHEFTLADRLIPYEITGHPRRGLGLGTGASTHTHAYTHAYTEYSQTARTVCSGLHARCMWCLDAKLTKKSAPETEGTMHPA